jgi:PPOX class probable F420-dependent enzyme
MLDQFMRQRNALLTTYKRDGTAVGTAVHVAVEEGRAYIRTYGKAWKWKRVRNTPDCELAPCTLRGRPTGPAIRVHGRILDGDEAARAARALARKYPLLHGFLIPRVHRLMRTPTIHMEFVGGTEASPASAHSA